MKFFCKYWPHIGHVPYFHTVFTIPEKLYSLVYSNPKLLYDALYHAAHLTMTELQRMRKYREMKAWMIGKIRYL